MPLCLSYFARGLDEDVLENHGHYARLHAYPHAFVEAGHIAHPAMQATYKYGQVLHHLAQLPEEDWLFFIDDDSVVFRPIAIDLIIEGRDVVVLDGPSSEPHGTPAPMMNMMIVRNTPVGRAVMHQLLDQSCRVLTAATQTFYERATLGRWLLPCNAQAGGVHVNVSYQIPEWHRAQIFVVCVGPLALEGRDGRPFQSMTHDMNQQAFLVRQISGSLRHGRPVLQPANYPALADSPLSSVNPNARIALVSLYTSHIASYARVSEHNLRRYCERHGHAYHVYRGIPAPLDPSINGTWVKTWLLLQHFKDHDWVIWVDADAIFYNQVKRLEPLLEGRDLLLAKDLGSWAVNAGVMGFRTTPKNQSLLAAIWSRIEQVKDRSGTYTSMGDQFYVNQVLHEEGLSGSSHVYGPLTVNTPPALATQDSLLVHFVNLAEPYRSAYMAYMDERSMRC